MLVISFEIVAPQHTSADTEYDKILRIKERFKNSGFTYELHQPNPNVLIHTCRGNCVAFAILFQRVANDEGLRSRTMVSPDHAYNLVAINGQEYIFDWCNFTYNYTENYRRLTAMHPGREDEIKEMLNKEFCRKYLGLDYSTADANLGNTSSTRFYTPGRFCTFRPDGTLPSCNVTSVQNHYLMTHCTRMFDWDAIEGIGTAVTDPSIVNITNEFQPESEPIIFSARQQTKVVSPKPTSIPYYTLPVQTVETDEDDELWVQRAYNGKVHHYTANLGEVRCLVEQHHWKHEQAAFKCFKAPKEGRFPIFRLYNPNDKNGNHLLTISEPERNWLVEQGWLAEGIEGYISITNTMYRLYNEDTSEHFYTENTFEAQAAEAAGWKPDGTVW